MQRRGVRVMLGCFWFENVSYRFQVKKDEQTDLQVEIYRFVNDDVIDKQGFDMHIKYVSVNLSSFECTLYFVNSSGVDGSCSLGECAFMLAT